MTESLDDDIAQVRAEIKTLTHRRKLLASSLLSSTKVQSLLSDKQAAAPTASQADSNNATTTTPLNLADLQQQSRSNAHRLAFGVTSFPFTDPSPELQAKNPLLGIRIDICNRLGKFDSPYYIFCIRASDTGQELRVHRHTTPALVPLQQYEELYLPLKSSVLPEDEGYGGSQDSRPSNDDLENGTGTKKQDLHGFVARVRHDLVSWRLRQDAVELLKEDLDLPSSASKEKPSERDDNSNEKTTDPDTSTIENDDNDAADPTGKFNITSLSTQGVDARQIRILWSDESLGRVRIADDGKIERARVIDINNNRAKETERILMRSGDDASIAAVSVCDLGTQLEAVYNKSMGLDVEEGSSAQGTTRSSGGRGTKRKRRAGEDEGRGTFA